VERLEPDQTHSHPKRNQQLNFMTLAKTTK